MNRRAFFSTLAAVIATAQMDTERLLWVPGRKLISIPAARVIENDLVNLYLRPAFIGIADRIDRDLCSAAPAFYMASHKHSPNDILIEVVPAHRGFPRREYPPWWRGPNSTAGQKRLAELARLGCVPGDRAASAGGFSLNRLTANSSSVDLVGLH